VTHRWPRTTALIVILVAGCGHGARPASTPAPPADPGPPPVDRQLLADIAAGLEEVLATMAAIAGGDADCPTMAGQLDELFTRSQPVFDLARHHAADPTSGPVLTEELDARAGAVAPLVERISNGLVRCKDDPGVVHAMERMPTL